MPNFIDLTGQRFGRWTVIDRASGRFTKSGRPIVTWRCKCECGMERDVDALSLRSGKSVSCGCYRAENSRAMTTERNRRNARYEGPFDKRLYQIWYSMNLKCYDETHKSYSCYGGRGISVCEEWRKDYLPFREWALSNGYKDNLTIDRIDVNGNYEPSNCRWATIRQQANNRRTNHVIEANGEKHTLKEWSEILSVSEYVAWYYASRGYTGDRYYSKLVSLSSAGGGGG